MEPSPPAGATRRLAAILHADVAGYSEMMGEDEAATHAAVREAMRFARETADAHGGRIVGTAGDAVLAEFSSTVEAVAAALDFQDAVAAFNAGRPEARPLLFRVGLNVGDLIVDGDDIFGDGVNVAQRVESLAPPGGIAVTEAVRAQVQGRLDVAFEDAGTHRLKNIAEPLRVHTARRPGAAAPASDGWRAGERRRARRATMVLAAIAVLAVAAIGALVVAGVHYAPQMLGLKLGEDGTDAARTADAALPTVAVLPFENRGEAEGWFSDGVTEDVIGRLGRFSGILVLSWTAVAPYRDDSPSLDALHRDLGARYVVGGSIGRSGDLVRLSVQLSDAERGLLLWSERYEEPMTELFAVQDRISRAVVDALSVEVTRVEADRAVEKPTESLSAYDHVLRGRELTRRISRDANIAARRHFEAAAALDPDYSGAYEGLGETHQADMLWGWSEWPIQSLETAERHLTRAVELAQNNARARGMLASVLFHMGELERARAEVREALKLNPSEPRSLRVHGWLLLYEGRLAEATETLERAARLYATPPVDVLVELGVAYFAADRHNDMVALLAGPSLGIEEDPAPHALLAAAYARLGRDDEARGAAGRALDAFPFLNGRKLARNIGGPVYAEELAGAFADAGLE